MCCAPALLPHPSPIPLSLCPFTPISHAHREIKQLRTECKFTLPLSVSLIPPDYVSQGDALSWERVANDSGLVMLPDPGSCPSGGDDRKKAQGSRFERMK